MDVGVWVGGRGGYMHNAAVSRPFVSATACAWLQADFACAANCRGIGRAAYRRAVVSVSESNPLQLGANSPGLSDEVANVINLIVEKARSNWQSQLESKLLPIWDQHIKTLGAASSNMITLFGKWAERDVQEDLLPSNHVSSIISDLGLTVAVIKGKIEVALEKMSKAVVAKNFQSRKSLRQLSLPLMHDLERASQLAYCLGKRASEQLVPPPPSPAHTTGLERALPCHHAGSSIQDCQMALHTMHF